MGFFTRKSDKVFQDYWKYRAQYDKAWEDFDGNYSDIVKITQLHENIAQTVTFVY